VSGECRRGGKVFQRPMVKQPVEFRLAAAGKLLEFHWAEVTAEAWHLWWAEWVRHESDVSVLSWLSLEMRGWLPLPEVILSAWREHAQVEEPDQKVRLLAWKVLAHQPIDLSVDIIRHLPSESDPEVLEVMAQCFPASTPVP